MKRRTFLNRSLLLLLAGGTAGATLAGCGFRLRGLNEPALELDRLSLNATPSSFTDNLRRELESAGVELTEEAPLRLNLGAERLQEVALGGGDLNYEETELRLTVPFSVQRQEDGAYLLDQQRIEVATTYQASDGNLLVRDDLRLEAVDSLYRDATRQLLERLRALGQ
ncbi:LPS-assembly lipoprotein [Modicisalibacter ilicicola DSM 19980]|uniref:LPS-assembly lipoprotein LptE n=1 Tax=Modicisalibacter ilicicola DSM 19980 TaxID=1121942 RepID=A0A1M4X270_9GAMM|nr:LPS assembly lipoprotein LptE [Halomonas ilicicola]SHE87584.1 LPS-assembly lipoprotein [Halomonas ilicicola DSM 19980]